MTVEEFMIGCEHDGSYIPVKEVVRLMQEFARIKCLEAIRNTRYAAIEILHESFNHIDWNDDLNLINCECKIQNIPNQDVIPEL